MDIMKIFTILLIVTIVILVFNLIRVEPFVFPPGDPQVVYPPESVELGPQCFNINDESKCTDPCLWNDTMKVCEDGTSCKRHAEDGACNKDPACEWNNNTGMCGDAGSCDSSTRAESQANCQSGDGKCKWNITDCSDICYQTKDKGTCDSIKKCSWSDYVESYYENSCDNYYDQAGCDKNKTCTWGSSLDLCIATTHPDYNNNNEGCWDYDEENKPPKGSSCVLREGECSFDRDNTECYELKNEECETEENKGACKLNAFCGEANEKFDYPDGYLNSLDTSESSCNSMYKNESKTKCDEKVEEGKPECKWTETGCLDICNEITDSSACNKINDCEYNTDTLLCNNTNNCNILDGDGCKLNEACKLDGWCGEGDLETSNNSAGQRQSQGQSQSQGHGSNYQSECNFSPIPTNGPTSYNFKNFDNQDCNKECLDYNKDKYDKDEENPCNDETECNKICDFYLREHVTSINRQGVLDQISTKLNTQHNSLEALQGELPTILSVGALLDKEEYLLRSLDSMGEKSVLKADKETESDNYCQEILNSSTCPKKLVSRYNRIRLHLNYEQTSRSESNTCIVTINLNYKCGSKNETQCNTDCIWDPEKGICSTVNNTDSIQKLIVKEVTENNKQTLKLESGIDGCVNKMSCSYFILRKICNKKEYIDLYDQYTTKYFVADPNIDYNDMYLLQPLYHPKYTLQLKDEENSDILILNELSGNKNEQFERIYE